MDCLVFKGLADFLTLGMGVLHKELSVLLQSLTNRGSEQQVGRLGCMLEVTILKITLLYDLRRSQGYKRKLLGHRDNLCGHRRHGLKFW